MKPEGNNSHFVDIHIGQCIRLARKNQGMSQNELAEACGISFQQVQKYERGTNRVSGSMLWMIAGKLGLPMVYFYQGLGAYSSSETPEVRARRDFIFSVLGDELISAAMAAPAELVMGATGILRTITDVVDNSALHAANVATGAAERGRALQ